MRDFFKQIFTSTIGSLIGVLLFFGLSIGGLLALIISAASRDTTPQVRERSVLTLNLSIPIRDTRPPSTLGDVVTGGTPQTLTLRQVVEAIDRATDDRKIVALLLDGSSGGSATGYATLKEVRQAIVRFRNSGKKVIAYDVSWSEREYYLASVADEVILNPIGTLELNGLSSQQTFFAGALEKYGIGVQIIRVGDFKSAVEPFTRSELSAENEQQLRALLGDIWQDLLVSIGENRDVSPEQLQQLADSEAFFSSQEAIAANLVDRAAYFDEVATQLRDLTEQREDRRLRSIGLPKYIDYVEAIETRQARDRIAVVYAEGNIVSGEGNVESIGGDRYARIFRNLRYNEDIDAVVVRINSPGGSATASEVILRELELLSAEKPVVISMGNVAASGGYWIATGGEYIFAEANTITGSIGVFGLLLNIQEIANENGITWDSVETAQFANIGTISRPKTEAELEIYQQQVRQIYDLFLERVAESRDLSSDRVAEIARGRVWSGEDALQVGLVDELGGLEAAIIRAGDRAEIERWQVEEYPRTQTFEERLLERLSGETMVEANSDPLSVEWHHLQQILVNLESLNDPMGIYVRLPFELRIE